MAKYLVVNDATDSLDETPFATTGGVGSANKPCELDAAGRWPANTMPVGIAPESKAGNAFEALAANSLVYIKTDGTVALASGVSGGNYATGWVDSSVLVGAPATVLFEGTISGLTGLTISKQYFLSDTIAGGVTATAPVGTGKLRQVVGVAISATELNFTNSGSRIKRA